jgi:hypothetical protein
VVDVLIQQILKWVGSLSGDYINYIVLGFLGGLVGNLKSAIDFLSSPTVSWPRGPLVTRFRILLGILGEVFYRPLVGTIMAYAVDINPIVSFVIGFIAPGILKLIEHDGPKLFKKYWETRLGLSSTSTNSSSSNTNNNVNSGEMKKDVQIKEIIKVVSADSLDHTTLKLLEDNPGLGSETTNTRANTKKD